MRRRCAKVTHRCDVLRRRWDGTKVDWKQADGVPNMPTPDPTMINTNGFRGGQKAEGDYVGGRTSLALDGPNNPGAAYYDRSHTPPSFPPFDGPPWTASGTGRSRSSGAVW